MSPGVSAWRAAAFHVLAALAVVIFSRALTAGQQSVSSATLVGTIEDMNGAAIQGASLRVTNLDTHLEWSATADRMGRFRFLYLPVGSYRLQVEASGFDQVQRKLTLSVGQTIELPLVLQVSGVSGKLEISSDTPVVEAVRTQIAETIQPREIDALPLNGRNYLDLAALTPGVTRANPVANQRFAETSAVPGTQISVAGQRNINNGFVLDGLSANDDAADLPGTFFSQEVIREFQVITSGGIAEFGRASSGVVNVVTQSGTDDWRGRLYGFLRNQRTDARNPLAATKDPLTQGQYGATIGGPVKRGRTFVFANFEQTRLQNSVVVTIAPNDVATVNSVLDQIGYAGPRITTGITPTGYDSSNFLARLDHRLNESNLLSSRYSYYDISSENARGVGGLSAVSRGTLLENRDQTFAASDVWTISPTIANELRFQVTRSRLAAPPIDLVGPAITVAGVANIGASSSSPTGRDLDLFEVVDNVTHQRGSHSFKFGVDLLYNRVNITFPGSLLGLYSFPNLGALQTGRYSTFQQAFGETKQFQSNPNVGFFVQDEWRIRPDLTLNAGLRYDVQFLPDPINTDADNIAPRIGLAYAPGDRRTVIRASYGNFFDRIPLRATSNALQRDGTKYKVATLSFGQAGAPVFPAPTQSFPGSFLPSITTIDPDIENAYSQQASLQIEREINPHTSIAVGYLHVRGLHLILSRNANVPRFPASAGVPNLGRPNPNFANISRFESSGDSYYNGLAVSFNRRFVSWTGVRLAYTFSKAIDNAGNAFFFTPQDNFNLRDERGLGDNDQRHRVALSGTIASPASGMTNGWGRIVKGFQLSYIFNYGSALPFNILRGDDRNNDTNVNDRPVGVGRNTGAGFDFASFDLRLSRHIRITERVGLEVIAEGFNLFNRTNLQLPNTNFGTGTVASASFRRPTAAADPRQIQFGLRLNF